jgi:hypothetical protein
LNQPFIQQVTADGRDIQRIVFDRLAPAVEGEPLSHSVMALITFSILLMRPDIDLDHLQAVVLSTSEHIIMAMSDDIGEAN